LTLLVYGDYQNGRGHITSESIDPRSSVSGEELSERSGVTCLASADNEKGHNFVTSAYKNLKAYNIAATLTPTPESIKALAPNDIKLGPLKGREGYANPVGGWAEAARATKVGLGLVVKEGGVVRGGCEVAGLEKEGRRVQGVVLKSGEVVRGEIILVSQPRNLDGIC